MTDFTTEATFDGGVMRWRSNGRVPFPDMVTAAAASGFPVDVAASNAAKIAEDREFIAAYRRNPPPLTGEIIAEARAAHGPGVTVVNVITGRSFRT